jgi:DNA-directed RNA polymerase specialized sigma24 family protein
LSSINKSPAEQSSSAEFFDKLKLKKSIHKKPVLNDIPEQQRVEISLKNTDQLLSPKELAVKLGCSLSYIKKLKRLGYIFPEISFHRYVRYNYTSVVTSLKKRGPHL